MVRLKTYSTKFDHGVSRTENIDRNVRLSHVVRMNALARWMRDNNIMNKDLAAQLGVDQSAVGHWKRGATAPQLSTAIRLARLSGGAVSVESWESDAREGAA